MLFLIITLTLGMQLVRLEKLVVWQLEPRLLRLLLEGYALRKCQYT